MFKQCSAFFAMLIFNVEKNHFNVGIKDATTLQQLKKNAKMSLQNTIEF